MSIWARISEAISALAKGEGLASLFERDRTPPERRVAFAIAVIGLGAKLAKADGHVTRDEVSAFREVFFIPPDQEGNAARIFNLARQDVAGFEVYARRIARMFGAGDPVLVDLLEGLFHIALADGTYHPLEDAFLTEVAGILGLGGRCFRGMRSRFVSEAPRDPYEVLGVDAEAPLEAVHSAWKRAVRDSHPDRMMARGVPPEAVKLAEKRLVALNAAWEEISRARAA